MSKHVVTNIENGVETKGNVILNRITFDNGYVALEKTTDGFSKFTTGTLCPYTITSKGHNKPDWIQFGEKAPTEVGVNSGSSLREYLIVMQSSLTNAVNYHSAFQSPTEGDIIETANKFADAVIAGANRLYIKHS